MSFQDKTLICEECNNEFIFSVKDQEFFAEKGFTNEPKRCIECRVRRRRDRKSSQDGGQRRDERRLYEIICDQCGEKAEVPFKPSGTRPVYCRKCFLQRGNGHAMY